MFIRAFFVARYDRIMNSSAVLPPPAPLLLPGVLVATIILTSAEESLQSMVVRYPSYRRLSGSCRICCLSILPSFLHMYNI